MSTENISNATGFMRNDAKSRRSRRAVFAGSVGNILEWYDFVLYAYLSPYIARHFFPAASESTSFLITLATFGVGFMARPVGAVLLGAYGDRVGRKQALTLVIVLMAIGTIMIGVTPSYERIGTSASATIVIARLLQGFASGGEWGGATTYIVESAPARRRGLFGSFQQSSLALALLLGSMTAGSLTWIFSAQDLNDWGWRTPFMVGGLLIGIFGLYLRVSVPDSPEHLVVHTSKSGSPVKTALTDFPRELITGTLFSIGWTVTNYLYLVYMPIYLIRTLHVPSGTALMDASIQLIFFMLLAPVMGSISDRIGRRPLMMLGAVSVIVGTYPLFLLMSLHPGALPILLVLCVFSVFMAMLTGPAPAWQVELFPAAVRTTSISLSYNFSVTIFGGFAPFIAAWLITKTGNGLSPSYYICAGACASLIAAILSKETAKMALRRD
jgi:MHS family proline/betaine transporter-like MFS transporter